MSILEIGPGRGDFLLHLAQEYPHKQIAAIEYKRKRFEKLARRLETYPNITLLFGDARYLLPTAFPPESLEEVYILFSDPWPKRRHAKHRLFQDSFLKDLQAHLKMGGRVFIATDDPSYREEIRTLFNATAGFAPDSTDFFFPTFYAQKWIQAGRSVHSLTYRRAC